MPLYALWRDLEPVPPGAEQETVMYRNVSATTWFPTVRWHRSYGIDAPGRVKGFCVYEGPSAAAVLDHSRFCGVPFVGMREVEEHRAPGVGAEPDAVPEGMVIHLLEWIIPEQLSPDEAWRDHAHSSMSAAGVVWVRSFYEPESGASHCILLAESAADIRAAVPLGGRIQRIERMWLSHPATWAYLYDSMGLPRHWEATAATV